MKLRNRVLAERLAQDRTQTEVAQSAGVHRKVLRWVEHDDGYKPNATTMLRLSQALGVGMGDLFWSEAPAEVA